MCQYCGCRDMPLIRDYIAEHERAINLGGDAVRAIDCGELAKAGELLGAMGAELRSHWQGEENGLFAVMGRDELYAEHIGPLISARDLVTGNRRPSSPSTSLGIALPPGRCEASRP